METENVLRLLDETTPFRFLRREDKLKLLPLLSECGFREGESIIRQGESNTDVFLLASGTVEALDLRGPAPSRYNTIEEGHYFGEYESLFHCPRLLEIRALDDVVCLRLAGEEFLKLLAHRRFSQPLGSILRDKQGLFAAFERFRAELMRGITRGRINLGALLPLYTDLEPALHSLARDRSRIDTSGLLYSVRRLPDNVTRTFVFLLADELPPAFVSADSLFVHIETEARRRSVWEILPGKNLVLLRSGLSDLVDLVTCLCLYAVEARKIRTRLEGSDALERIKAYLANPEGSDKSAGRDFLGSLGFSADETEGLISVWGLKTVERIYDIARHREVFTIDVQRQKNNYLSRRSELWTQQIEDATKDLVGKGPTALPEDVRVHVISSNTHSVLNCLNPWLAENRELVFAWARKADHPLMRDEWPNEYDLLYALSRDYLSGSPDTAREIRRNEKTWGIVRLKETASTGIQVQLIDASRLSGLNLDPGIAPAKKDARNIIVNIDYAFGEQAEHVIRNLLMLFGRNLASVNLLGKAGALLGKRGDILMPTAFIKQTSERYEPLLKAAQGCEHCLSARVPGREVHLGPMLTVDGTLLQNRKMLYFYKHLWGCIGIEMEGAYYYRQVLEARRLGIIPEDVELRFYYYVSDLPLDHASNLSSRLGAMEGIPPLYAITREVLTGVFDD